MTALSYICNIHIWDSVSTEYRPAIVVWSRIELPDTSAHDSGSIDSVESDWQRAIDGYLGKVNNHVRITHATSQRNNTCIATASWDRSRHAFGPVMYLDLLL